jgi:hypothetical protein
MKVGSEPLSSVLDFAADRFAEARRSRAAEGLRAFAEKTTEMGDRMIACALDLPPARERLSTPRDVPCRERVRRALGDVFGLRIRRQSARAGARYLVVAAPLLNAGRARLRARGGDLVTDDGGRRFGRHGRGFPAGSATATTSSTAPITSCACWGRYAPTEETAHYSIST